MKSPVTAVLAFAAGAWMLAWFLPAAAGMPGWMAFWNALGPLRHANDAGVETNAPAVLSALTNLVFVVLWSKALAGSVRRPGLFLRVAIACLLLNLYWLVEALRAHSLADLRAGYYLWLAAFAALVATGVSIHRTSRTPTAGTPA